MELLKRGAVLDGFMRRTIAFVVNPNLSKARARALRASLFLIVSI